MTILVFSSKWSKLTSTRLDQQHYKIKLRISLLQYFKTCQIWKVNMLLLSCLISISFLWCYKSTQASKWILIKGENCNRCCLKIIKQTANKKRCDLFVIFNFKWTQMRNVLYNTIKYSYTVYKLYFAICASFPHHAWPDHHVNTYNFFNLKVWRRNTCVSKCYISSR